MRKRMKGKTAMKVKRMMTILPLLEVCQTRSSGNRSNVGMSKQIRALSLPVSLRTKPGV